MDRDGMAEPAGIAGRALTTTTFSHSKICDSLAQLEQSDVHGPYTMPEFRKLFDLPSAKLCHADVVKLGRLISDGLLTKPGICEFSLSHGDAVHKASSLDELLSQDLPQSIDRLSFRVVGWRDNDIDRSLSVDLGRRIASCQISSSDEIWFRGKIQQITEFFRQLRPWHGRIKQSSIAAVFGLFQGFFC